MPTGGAGPRAGTRPAHAALEAGLRVRSPEPADPGPWAPTVGITIASSASTPLSTVRQLSSLTGRSGPRASSARPVEVPVR